MTLATFLEIFELFQIFDIFFKNSFKFQNFVNCSIVANENFSENSFKTYQKFSYFDMLFQNYSENCRNKFEIGYKRIFNFPSNAFCESVFSIKTDEINRMKIKLFNFYCSIPISILPRLTKSLFPILINKVKICGKYAEYSMPFLHVLKLFNMPHFWPHFHFFFQKLL